MPSRRAEAIDAAERGGVEVVADAVAEGVVSGLFPPARTRTAAGSSRTVSAVVRHRYRRTEKRFGVDRSGALADGEVDAANDRLAAGIADRVASDLRSSNTSAREAAAGVRLGSVRITVRTWP
jgi:hypothetical protein